MTDWLMAGDVDVPFTALWLAAPLAPGKCHRTTPLGYFAVVNVSRPLRLARATIRAR
jgi:hypothetical protein